MQLIQTTIDGLVIGGVYAIIAIGLTLIFGVMRVINMAHGEFVMIGMFVSYFLFKMTNLDPFLSTLISAPVCFLIGFLLYKTFVEKARKISEENTLLLTAGAGIFIINVMALPFLLGPNYVRLSGEKLYWENKVWYIGNVSVNSALATGFIFTAILIVLLHFLLTKTDIGLAIRASAQVPMAAKIVGVNVSFISAFTFGLGSAFAGIAGSILATNYPIYANIGSLFLVKAFIIVVLGGMGSIPGAALGGIILGLTENFGSMYFPDGSSYRDAFGLIIFLIVLLYRPQGLFGKGV